MPRRWRSVSKFKKKKKKGGMGWRGGWGGLWIRRDRIEMEQWTARLLSNLFPVRLGSFSPEWDVNVKEREKRNIFILPPPFVLFVWRLSLEVAAWPFAAGPAFALIGGNQTSSSIGFVCVPEKQPHPSSSGSQQNPSSPRHLQWKPAVVNTHSGMRPRN